MRVMKLYPVQNVETQKLKDSSHLFHHQRAKVRNAIAVFARRVIYKIKMIIIKCAKCKSKIFKYRKVGEGRVLRCYKDRIVKYYPIRDKGKIQCLCGQLIGVDEGKWIKMNQNAFEYSGNITKK